ncbi:MAG: Thivi_2564 family membrane protein [Legionellales bacterium]
MNSELLNLLAVIVLFGVVGWVIFAFIPMAASVKSLLNALIVIILLIYILQFFGIIKTILPMIKLLH